MGLAEIYGNLNTGGIVRIKFKPHEQKKLRILTSPEDINGQYEHVIQDKDGKWMTAKCLSTSKADKVNCPCCASGNQASYRFYLEVVDEEDDTVKFYKAPKSVGMQIASFLETYKAINNRLFIIKRIEGEIISYQVLPLDKDNKKLDKYESTVDLKEMMQETEMAVDEIKERLGEEIKPF